MFFKNTSFTDSEGLAEYIKKNFFSESESLSVGRDKVIRDFGMDYQALTLDYRIVECMAEWILFTLEASGGKYKSFQLIGVETSGIPLVAGISMYLKLKYYKDVNIAYLRKKKDIHGKMNFVEGRLLENVPLIFVDEHYLSGDTFRKAKLILANMNVNISEAFFLITSQDSLPHEYNCNTLLRDVQISGIYQKIRQDSILDPLVKNKKINLGATFLSLDLNYDQKLRFFIDYDKKELVFSYHKGLFVITNNGDGLIFRRFFLNSSNVGDYKINFLQEFEKSYLCIDSLGFFWKISKDFSSKEKMIGLSTGSFLKKVTVPSSMNQKPQVLAVRSFFKNHTKLVTCDFRKDELVPLFSVNFSVDKMDVSENAIYLQSASVLRIFDYNGEQINTINNILYFKVSRDTVYYSNRSNQIFIGIYNQNPTQHLLICTTDEQSQISVSKMGIIVYSLTGSISLYGNGITWANNINKSICLEPTYHEGFLFVTSIYGSIYVLDATSGKIHTIYEFGDQIIELKFINSKDILCICCENIYSFIFDKSNINKHVNFNKTIFIG